MFPVHAARRSADGPGGRLSIDYADWKRLLADEALPAALVDLDALDANVRTVARFVEGRTTRVRVATKSVRVPELLRNVLREPPFSGLMCYTMSEAARLAELGFDDLLVAYPLAHAGEAATLRGLLEAGKDVVPVIDDPAHVELLRGSGARVCIDADASLRVGGLHLGVRRSPLRDVANVRSFARRCADAGLRVAGLMAYEAQVAGVPDGGPFPMSAATAWMKARSVRLARERREALVTALREDGHVLTLVNGGGTGSLATTSTEASVTEVTAGSALMCGHLFDHYRWVSLVPAGFFALRVVRRPDAEHVTAFGGGVVASGAAGRDRHPLVHAPVGLRPLSMEGWGEVQTPFRGSGAEIGDPVVCRPAKSGEWLERFAEVVCVRGTRVVARMPTYRGLGWCCG